MEITLCHHEKWAGSGKDSNISHFAPLLADVFLENDSAFRDIFHGVLNGKA
ncbi:hypothetical protein ABFV83_04295 [Lacrimispora sp. BS-2]|uniref:HD-GYP domain-containing protein n=1 Tax=Lacrimispora sp. BS-2 TaxID=3151850 RepID=A0AAU7PRN1_9FIRM